MELERRGLRCVSLAGWQAGVQTSSVYSDARIKRIDPERILSELDQHRIVLVAGFQGIDRTGDITTLGRGGSDTSAVALAASFHAELCQIFTDVDGVYTTDPRIVSNARKLSEITYDEMLELASQGAQVLHNRSVELAKKFHGGDLRFRVPGFIVGQVERRVLKYKIGKQPLCRAAAGQLKQVVVGFAGVKVDSFFHSENLSGEDRRLSVAQTRLRGQQQISDRHPPLRRGVHALPHLFFSFEFVILIKFIRISINSCARWENGPGARPFQRVILPEPGRGIK